MSAVRGAARFFPVLPVVIVVVAVAWWLLDDEAVAPTTPTEISADGPRFAMLGELARASDLAVHAEVVAVDDGRAITDPARLDAGIRTQLAQLDVAAALAGAVPDALVVEQEAALLDGTPITVNGVPPLVEGDAGLLFLVHGTTDEFPYTALVNEQAWVPVVEGRLRPFDPTDPVWSEWAGRPIDDLLRALGSGAAG